MALLTYPEDLRRTRRVVGESVPILVAGLGAQGGNEGDLQGVFGLDANRLLVNVSRGIIFPSQNSYDYFSGVAMLERG